MISMRLSKLIDDECPRCGRLKLVARHECLDDDDDDNRTITWVDDPDEDDVIGVYCTRCGFDGDV